LRLLRNAEIETHVLSLTRPKVVEQLRERGYERQEVEEGQEEQEEQEEEVTAGRAAPASSRRAATPMR
jgi:hypothetical protein